jgi:Undecaprenyl-phosphate glucose phosphotransferase
MSFAGTAHVGRTLNLFGLTIRDATLPEAAATIIAAARSNARLNVAFVNAHCVNQFHQDESYRRSLQAFDVLYADGVGMRIAAKAAGDDLADNVNGTDLFPILCEEAAESGVPIYLLGAQRGRADKTARRMALLYPGLNIAGTHHGFFESPEDEQAVIDRINASDATILFVALGVPLQEKWIERNRARLRPNVILGVGGLFDYYSGAIPRAPERLRDNGLEWAWRLVQEPKRLWRRYVIGNLEFMARVAWCKLVNADIRQYPDSLATPPEASLRATVVHGTALEPASTLGSVPELSPGGQTVSRLSRRVFSDVAVAASIATAIIASWLMMPPVEASTAMGLFPVYVVLLATFVHSSGIEIFEKFRQRDLDVQVFVHSAAVLGAAALTWLTSGSVPLPFMSLLQWLTASFAGGLGIIYLGKRLAASAFFAPRLARRVAVFGSGPISARVYEEIRTGKSELEFSGLYDDRHNSGRLVDCGVKVDGSFNDLVERAKRGEIDEIILALPQSATRRIAECARKLAEFPVDVHICTHVATEYPGRHIKDYRTSMLGAVGLLQLRARPLNDWSAIAKRAEDLVAGSILLVLTLPVFVAAAVAVKLSNKGPVFFIQNRMGLNNRKIRVIKFRTMSVMEDGATVVQASKNDDRITAVGRVLRKWSIDELPQLINVLRGEMSLVGPRPHALAHDKYFGSIVYRYANRHQVKPGITGLAQISGYRGETPHPRLMSKRVQYDLWYIENWSLLLDLKVILFTPFSCLLDKKAY